GMRRILCSNGVVENVHHSMGRVPAGIYQENNSTSVTVVVCSFSPIVCFFCEMITQLFAGIPSGAAFVRYPNIVFRDTSCVHCLRNIIGTVFTAEIEIPLVVFCAVLTDVI